MKLQQIFGMLQGLNLPVAYDHFAEGEAPKLPYVIYREPGSDNFNADGRAYYKIDELDIELYTETKDRQLEDRLEDILDRHGICYNKTENWIDSEKMFEILYETEV